ncbi:MAG: tRNA (adenosine(37)-N6)-threonylcarbamoyltransferase complex dimerization subunit type 1 TsaB [Endozoicomonadaceae bacterium]|nr:tRNA (adenosine(37)-N6)-threonylcarbamoyltransferase complex dimerization subunit type 1 TsaB [Endozoicomonadaceae bacterium]
MTNLLAIDTSTEACSVALSVNGKTEEIFAVIPRLHSQKVLPAVEQLLTDAGINRHDIDAIAFGRGPGAFTGIRIATAITQGLAFALDRPVIPVSSLAALAQQAVRKHNATSVLAAIDARMGEVYWGQFTVDSLSGCVQLQGNEQISKPEDVLIPADESSACYGIGNGWQYAEMADKNVTTVTKDTFPHAQDIITLAHPLFLSGQIVNAEMAIPVYLRNNVADRKH